MSEIRAAGPAIVDGDPVVGRATVSRGAVRAGAAMVNQPAATTPTGGAGGVLAGTYPNPGFAVNMTTQAVHDDHVAASEPHPAYDDLPSFRLIYENGLI